MDLFEALSQLKKTRSRTICLVDDGQKMLENYTERSLLDVILHSLHALASTGLADVVMTFSDQSHIETVHEGTTFLKTRCSAQDADV